MIGLTPPNLQTFGASVFVCVCVFVALTGPLAEQPHLQFCMTDTDKQQSVCKYTIKLLKWVEFYVCLEKIKNSDGYIHFCIGKSLMRYC